MRSVNLEVLLRTIRALRDSPPLRIPKDSKRTLVFEKILKVLRGTDRTQPRGKNSGIEIPDPSSFDKNVQPSIKRYLKARSLLRNSRQQQFPTILLFVDKSS